MRTDATQGTEALFLKDTYTLEAQGMVVSIKTMADGRVAAITDRTVFFPQGGGQPSDTGVIIGGSGSVRVDHVVWDDQAITHLGQRTAGDLSRGDVVTLRVDGEKRMLHARIHTAGELICAAVRNIGHESWRVAGAIHYSNRASVEYFGSTSADARGALQDRLQAEMDHLVEVGGLVEVATVSSRHEAEKLCGFFPDYLLEGEPIRIVTVHGEIGRPCQGTHVADIAEIGGVSITKVKSRKGRTKISYALRDARPPEFVGVEP